MLYHKALCRQARLVLPPNQDPENAVGDVWLKALRAARRYDSRRDPYPWLARICVNTCLNQRRSLLRRFAGRLTSEPTAPPAWEPADADALARLRSALARLSPRLREAVALRYLFGVSVGEIARLTGRSPQAIEKRIVRALNQLRALWPGEEPRERLESLGRRS